MTTSQLDERIEVVLDANALASPGEELREQIMLTAAARALDEAGLEEIIESVARLGFAHFELAGDASIILAAHCLIEELPQRVRAVFAALAGRKPCPIELLAVNAELCEITRDRIDVDEILQAARACGVFLLGEPLSVLAEDQPR